VMWRFAKRFAVKAARTAGRNVGAGVRSAPAREPEKEAGRVAREQCRARSTQTCESLVQLRTRWELEAAAAARRGARRRAAEPADDAARAALDMVRAMRHAGVRWVDIATNPAVRGELGDAARHAWSRTAGAPAGALVRAAMHAAREVVGPTLALRHAGGSWRDVVSHPASRLLYGVFRRPSGGAQAGPTQAGLTRAGHGGKTVGVVSGAGSTTVAQRKISSGFVRHHYELMSPIERVSSADALRHAGASWIDVVTHHAFRSCFTNRAKAATWSAYVATFVRHPFPTALVTSVGKCVVSDVAVQTMVEGKRLDEVDGRRVFCFFALGLTYVGAFQYGLYNRLMKPAGDLLSARFGTSASVATMVALDQFVVCPVIYLPTFFGLKQWSSGECGIVDVPGKIATKMTMSEYDAAEFVTMSAMWAYWIPAQAINFWIVPRHLTIPFMNLLGFGWNAIMSAMNGSAIGDKGGGLKASKTARSSSVL